MAHHPTYRLLKEIQNSSIVCPSDLEWGWDPLEATTEVNMAEDTFDIVMHPNSSRGTGGVRGDTAFVPGQIYYWEIEVNGEWHKATDMIVGVGTRDFNLKSSEDQYCSLIGSDRKSWGYSYQGAKHHNGERLPYGQRFDKSNTLIGVRLDMWRGTLEFFVNRKPLGVAYRKLNKEHLYPMVCSTACQTQFKVKYCRSLPVNLQLLCLQALDSSHDSSMPYGLLKEVMDSWWIPKY